VGDGFRMEGVEAVMESGREWVRGIMKVFFGEKM
jgi:hypothetical protein